MFESSLKKNIRYSGIIGSMIMFSLTTLYYNILFDIVLIMLLFLSSNLLGNIFLKKIEINNKNLISTALGLGVLGISFYFLLFLNIGKKSFFLIVLMLPIILGKRYIKNLIFQIEQSLPKTKKEYILFVVVFMFFLFYIAYGSAPISKYDALTKHLPITIFGAENGRFNYNVIESMVYGESMLMNYTYSIMFASFNAFKAISLFNVIINFWIFRMLVVFSKSIYENVNVPFLTIIYFSTPMFFEFSTVFYLDILPIYFFLGAILCYCDLKKEEAWISLPIVSFLFGCSVFSKLTISYSVLVVGLIILELCILYAYKNKSLFQATKYFLGSFALFVFPFITSLINIWYRTGNPLFPFYNNIFKSPYFPIYKFEDPFKVSPLSLSVNSLLKIIFQTSKNVEMYNGGLGLFMLLIIFIPVSIFINRSKKNIIWSIAPFIMFGISCLFTYNLRYNIAIFMLFLSIITISLSIILDKININVHLKRTIKCTLVIILFFPNSMYIGKHYSLKESLKYNKEITKVDNKSLLNQIPQNKKVLSLNDPFKGEYIGFFSSYMWHNSYNMDKVSNKLIKIEDYISSFDYVIYQKELAIYSNEIDRIISNVGSETSILLPYYESSTHILFKVKDQRAESIYEERMEKPKISNTSKPIIYKFDKVYDNYQITQDVENISNKNLQMRFQINWYDNKDKFLDTSISTYTLGQGRSVKTSQLISNYSGAAYGIVYITSHNNEEVLIHGYRVDGYENKARYLSEELEKYNQREMLKNNEKYNKH